MRVGFIGDVHGEIEALRWALETLADTDRIMCLGDVVDGPEDGACIRLLQDRGIPVLRGNHDHWAALDKRVGNLRTPEEIAWLLSLPFQHLEQGWLAYHSRHAEEAGEVHWEYLLDDRSVRFAFDEHPQQLLFCGHTHVASINVLGPAGLQFLSTSHLRESGRIRIEPDNRYLVNAGRPTQCVVWLDTERSCLEYRFAPEPRSEAAPRSRPGAAPSWWRRLWSRRRPPKGEFPAF